MNEQIRWGEVRPEDMSFFIPQGARADTDLRLTTMMSCNGLWLQMCTMQVSPEGPVSQITPKQLSGSHLRWGCGSRFDCFNKLSISCHGWSYYFFEKRNATMSHCIKTISCLFCWWPAFHSAFHITHKCTLFPLDFQYSHKTEFYFGATQLLLYDGR